MKKLFLIILSLCMILLPLSALAATEQAKQQAIDDGLAWLAGTMVVSGSEGYFPYSYDGTLAATASAALAFIEEGYLPGDGSTYGTQVQQMCNYIFNRAKTDTSFGVETAGYTRYAEDYNNDGDFTNDGGNNQAIFFDPSYYKRDIYTNGIVAPVIQALGNALGRNTTVGMGSAVVSGMTYAQVMQDLTDWFSYGQVEPDRGVYRGGWRYTPNYSSSDNSTAQWGALPMLYAEAWGLGVPDYVNNELELWVNYIQHPMDGTYRAGGSGYTYNYEYVNPAKTAGLLLELAVLDVPSTDARVQNALAYLQSMIGYDHWNQGATNYYGEWYGGNFGNPYSMWAIYKALEVWGIDTISTAPGGFTVGQDWDPQTSAAGDWYAQYCDWLVNDQNANGSWNGYAYWNGALSAGWYINILNAAGTPPPAVPEPATMLLLGSGLIGMGALRRRKKK